VPRGATLFFFTLTQRLRRESDC